MARLLPPLGWAGWRPDADIVAETLVRLDRYLRSRQRVPIVRNPSLPSENLARAWPQTHFPKSSARKSALRRLLLTLHGADLTLARGTDCWEIAFRRAFERLIA